MFEGADVVARCNAGNLFGDARLVLVEAIDGRPNADNRLTGGWKAADIAAAIDYLGSPAPATILALVAAELKPDANTQFTGDNAALLKNVFDNDLGTAWTSGKPQQEGVGFTIDFGREVAIHRLVIDQKNEDRGRKAHEIPRWTGSSVRSNAPGRRKFRTLSNLRPPRDFSPAPLKNGPSKKRGDPWPKEAR